MNAIRNFGLARRSRAARLVYFTLIITLALAGLLTPSAESRPDPSGRGGAALQAAKKQKFFVSPSGRPQGAGTKRDPWDLQTALDQPPNVRPGATIMLRGGIYRGNFRSKLTGASGAPITVRPFKTEHVVIDGWNPDATTPQRQKGLVVHGAWVVIRDLEITSTDPRRTAPEPGSSVRVTPGWRGDGVEFRAPNSKLVNLVIHDTGQGIAFWEQAVDSEIYGCVLFNNGWGASDRGHGHGIYIQNEVGRKLVRDVISFNNFANGMKAYAQGGQAIGIHFDGVMSFNNGASYFDQKSTRNESILVGTTQYPPRDIKVLNGIFYQPPGTIGGGLRLGYTAENDDVEVRGNYIACGGQNLILSQWKSAVVRDNLFVTTDANGSNSVSANVKFPADSPEPAYAIDANAFFDASPPAKTTPRSFAIDGVKNAQGGGRLTFEEWRAAKGWDGGSKYTLGLPTGTHVFVRPNRYQPGRAHIAVFNWGGAASVDVDVDGVLPVGARFELRNAQDYFGPPVLAGTYSGRALRVPTTNLTTATPTGLDRGPAPTGPVFNVFVLIQK